MPASLHNGQIRSRCCFGRKAGGSNKAQRLSLAAQSERGVPKPAPGRFELRSNSPQPALSSLWLCEATNGSDVERSGEGGIRTRDGVFTPYSLSRRVPSAARPPLPERTEGQFRACSERPCERVGSELPGRVAERLNAAVLKTVRRAIPVSGVRIPPLPLVDPQRRDGAVRSSTGRHAPRGSRATSQPRGR